MQSRVCLEPGRGSLGSQKLQTRRSFCAAAIVGFAPSLQRDSVIVMARMADGKLTIIKDGNGDERRAELPGSVIKPLVLAALFERGKLKADDTFLCRGKLTVAGRQLNCVHPRTATPFNAERAIAYSCNSAVAHWAMRMTTAELADALTRNGPRPQGNAIDVRLLALGEAGIRVSALDLVHAYQRTRLPDAVVAGMEAAVAYGTAQRAALPQLRVAGKTGSGGTVASGRIAWFAGFAPAKNPEVVTVVMAAGNSGGADAAPLARQAWLDYFGTRA